MRRWAMPRLLATLVVGLLLTGPANHADAQEATAPELTSASVQGNLLYADYDQVLDESHTPPLNAYVVRINGKRTRVQNVAVSGQRVTLTLQAATIDGDTVALTYRHRARPTLRSASGVNAATVRNVAVEVLSPEAQVEPETDPARQTAVAPELTSASVQGTMLYADYDQALDESHTPPLNAYVIRINGKRTTVQTVAVSGQRVTLTLQAATIGGDTVLLTYRHTAQPTLRSVSGGLAATVRNVAVEVLSPEAVVETFEPDEPRSAEARVEAPPTQFLPSDSALIPIGVSTAVASKFRILHVSRRTYQTTESGIEWYNTNNDVPLGTPDYIKTHYRAVLCTTGTNVKTNTATDTGSEKIYWPNGDKVADDYADFYDGSWDTAYHGGEGDTVWTGCFADGRTSDFNAVGRNSVVTTKLINSDISELADPLNNGAAPRGNSRRIVSLSEAITAANPPPAWQPPGVTSGTYRIMNVSRKAYQATSNDIAWYNARAEAPPGVTGVEFKALGCTSSVNVKNNTGTGGSGGEKIYWPNGAEVADNYADLYDDKWDTPYRQTRLDTWSGCFFDGRSSNLQPLGAGGSVATGQVADAGVITQTVGFNRGQAPKGSRYPIMFLSPVLQVKNNPGPPAPPTVESLSHNMATIDWDTPAYEGIESVDGHDVEIRHCTDLRGRNCTAWSAWFTVGSRTGTDDANTKMTISQYTDAANNSVSLQPGERYVARVRAKSGLDTGETSYTGDWSDPVEFTLSVQGDTTAPFVPTNFRLTVRNNAIQFEWDAPSNGRTVKGYEFRWDDDTDPTVGGTVVPVPVQSPQQSVGSRGQVVSGQVRAQDGSNNWGPYTHVLYATPNRSADQQAPDKPAAPTVTPGDGQLTVTWTAPADHGCSITRYQVRHQRAGTTGWAENRNAWKIDSGGALSYTISRLPNGQSYNVQVRADGLCGSSDWSDSGTGTPGVIATATIAAGSSPITEGGQAVFTVNMDPPVMFDVTVHYSVAASGAYGVSNASNRTVTIRPGTEQGSFSDGKVNVGTIVIGTSGDGVDEASGSVTVTLATGAGYSLGTTTSASVTVNDDDPSGEPVVSIAPGDPTITEGGDAQFTILASGPPSVDLTVSLAVSGGGDFGVTAETRTVTLPAGASVATLTVGTTDDSVAERADDVTVTVTTPDGSGYAVSSDHGSASVRINDNDGGFNAPANVQAIGGMARFVSEEAAPLSQVRLAWDAPPDSPQITGYELQESNSRIFRQFFTPKQFGRNQLRYTAKRNVNDPPTLDNDGHPNIGHRRTSYFRIRALTGTGDDGVRGPWSPVVAATPSELISPSVTSDADIELNESPPLGPAPVIAVAGDASLTVYWGIPADRGPTDSDPQGDKKGHAIVAYDLRYRAGDSGTWTTVKDVWTESLGGILKYEFRSPINFQAYQVQVRAQDRLSYNDCAALNAFDNRISDEKCARAPGAWSSIVTATPSDYDADDDGLIEVRTLAQLNAMRYDLDGDGVVTDDPSTSGTDEFTEYTNAFHYPALAQGCPADGCDGYELVANLDFDENGDGTRNDTYNTGAGWQPIGIFSDDGDATNDAAFTAVFEGNGNTVSNLFISRSGADYVGLFGHASFANIRNLGLENVDVTGGNNVGGLAGWNEAGAISDSYVTGSVSGVSNVGGLAGRNNGSITTSYSAAAVSGTGSNAGGLVGRNGEYSSILASYSTGAVSGVNKVGGFAGSNWGAIETSFSTGAVSGTGSEVGGFTGSGRDTDDEGNSVRGSFADNYYDRDFSGVTKGVGDWLDVAGVDGIRTDRLRRPTAYGTGTDIYANWNVDLDGDSTNDNPWDFGASHNYPTLRNTGGHQKGPGRVGNLAAALNGGNLVVSWSAPTEAGAGTLTGNYAGRYSIDGGSTWTAFSTTGATTYTITNLQANTSYDIEVWAIGQGTAHTRGAPESFEYTPVPITDYDSDGDGLLEISNLAQLNAIRWDLDGDGMVDNSANDISYTAAFPNPEAGMGCPDIGCTGYELTASLDFDTNVNNRADNGDTYWNDGAGWLPIAGAQNIGANEGFQATFEGNDYAISNLFINRYRDYAGECAQHADTPAAHSACLERIEWAGYRIGLFGAVGDMAVIRNLTLEGVDVTGEEEVGGLAGISLGEIDMVDVTGDVSGATIDVGGLVGFLLRGRLINSAFDGAVSGTASHMGGLVGANTGATIRYSEAAGTVAPSGSSSGHVGGLAGSNTGTIAASSSTSTVNANDAYWVGGLVGTNGGMYAKGSGRIIACYARNDVHGKGDVGGLVGENYASISTSYSTGAVHKHGGQYAGPVGGLVGRNELNNNDSTVYYSVTKSYWNLETGPTDWTFGVGSDDDNGDNVKDSDETNTVPGHTTLELQSPTGYNGIYENWNVDVDGNGTPDDPWNFGTHNDYPVLEYPVLD